MHHGNCESLSFDAVRCWEPEGHVWDEKLASMITEAVETARETYGTEAATALQTAHDRWLAQRDGDCRQSGSAYAAGTAYCTASLTHTRVEEMLGLEGQPGVARLTSLP